MKRPDNTEHPEYFKKYIDLVKGDNVIKTLENQVIAMQAFLSEIPEEKENYSYQKDKWTIKEVIGHIIDTERIMSYRALRFARGDKNELAGFEQEDYVKNANFNERSLYSLVHEFGVLRESNITMFKSFNENMLNNKGKASGRETSVRALIFLIAGHQAHHLGVIERKYLN